MNFLSLYFISFSYEFVFVCLVLLIQVGRSKWNGNVGGPGIVLRADTPLTNVGRPYFSVQINSGIEF